MRIVEQYLLQLNTEKRRWRRSALILVVLSLVVALSTAWNLRMTGITIANSASCGMEEHRHSEDCMRDGVPVCGSQEHIHRISCYSDPSADVESAAVWEETLPQDMGRYWSENLARIAASQLGYQESQRNFAVADDGVTRHGLTRYGQWYGNPHGEWSAMFVAFCLHYAGVPAEAIPQSPGVYNMMQLSMDKQILLKPDRYVGDNGNILFLDMDSNGKADQMLIVMALDENLPGSREIRAVGGDVAGAVREVKLQKNDPRILGYIPTAAVREAYTNSVSLQSIDRNNSFVYTIDVYLLPVDGGGNRINSIPVTQLSDLRVDSSTKKMVESLFDESLGAYKGAYFGTETSVTVDNIASVWRYSSYYLAYEQTNGDANQRWKSRADTTISLYLRYTPEFTVTYASDGFSSLTERVTYQSLPQLTEPASWTRPGYVLIGWKASDNQTVYTYEELMTRPVTADVTYRAQWRQVVQIRFDLGAYADALYPIEPLEIAYGETVSPLPTPGWQHNTVAMAFDGWYLNPDLTRKVSDDYAFYENTTLYAKWCPKEEGYYVYFMDFPREGQSPLVLMTYSVTEGQTAAPYTPPAAPEGAVWDERWYLDSACTKAFDFTAPISQMTEHLAGANQRDLYLYPGTKQVNRVIFITYGTRVDPVAVPVGSSIQLDDYRPERQGYNFAGWTLEDGTPISGEQTITEDTVLYAKWDPAYSTFEAVLRIENANDTGLTQADVLGTWYALSGSQIKVVSTYSGSGTNRTGTHRVVCVIDGKEYPVYTDEALTKQATLSDVYATYFVYNNTGTKWTDETNWDDVYTGGELPYSTRPVSSAGDTIIFFDYMRVRKDIVFNFSNSNSSGGYLDIYKLQQNGLITGSVTYTGTKPTTTGKNVSATGVFSSNVRWTYKAATSTSGTNSYTLHGMKYGQQVYEVYPVGGSWITPKRNAFNYYTINGKQFASRRDSLVTDFFSGSGRRLSAYPLTASFSTQKKIALMYAMECLPGEIPDFTVGGVDYKVQPHLCEVVNSSGNFSAKNLLGYVNAGQGTYSSPGSGSHKIGDTSVKTLFETTYWDYYKVYDGVTSLSNINTAYIFYYTRLHLKIEFNLGYDSNGDEENEVVLHENLMYGQKLSEYQFGMPNYGTHTLLHREGYEFVGWLDANGVVLPAEAWASMIATGDVNHDTIIFIAKWEKISHNIVEYYEDRNAANPFEIHYFDDGDLLQFPTLAVYPQGWVWQEYGEGTYKRFDWDVPMYGEQGVREIRRINGENVTVNVIRIYGTWDESHTQVVYDPNPAQGGVQGTAPTDSNEYTIWQSEVSLKMPGGMENTDPDMIFVGWLLNRNGVVYQPGDHVSVHWPRTMIFTAQWSKREEVVHLRYDPNGGMPGALYPDGVGMAYKKNAVAAVWDNLSQDATAWYSRPGYVFTGWNTQPDGSGTAYAANSTITLTQAETVLYAQWESVSHTIVLHKVSSDDKKPLSGAVFGLYVWENGAFQLLETLTTGKDGQLLFADLRTDALYKLVEERPPDGYGALIREFFVQIIPEGQSVTFVFCDAGGNPVEHPTGVIGEYFAGIKMLSLTVENLRGYALPATGGIGTPIYLLCGSVLVLTPLVYGFSLRRRYERRSKH